MFADLVIFMYMAYRYKPTDKFWQRDLKKGDDDDDEDEKKGKDNDALDRSE